MFEDFPKLEDAIRTYDKYRSTFGQDLPYLPIRSIISRFGCLKAVFGCIKDFIVAFIDCTERDTGACWVFSDLLDFLEHGYYTVF